MSAAKILELAFKAFRATLLAVLIPCNLWSQDVTSARFLEFRYGYQLPMADMADRFGANSNIGVNFESIKLKSKVFYGADGIFLFGINVKEDVVAPLRSIDGNLIGLNGARGDVNLKERGYYIGLNAGKIFPFGKSDNNVTGIRAQVGAGFLQHKIRVQDNFNNIAALDKQYITAYDRLSNGPAIHLAAGYQYQNPKNNFHFHILADLYGARTLSRRDFDHVTGGYLDKKRTDILAGLSIAYIVTISRSAKPDNIYY